MQRLTEQMIEAGWTQRVVSTAQLARLLDGTPQRRYNLVNRALQQGELLQLRRGLYLLAARPPEQLTRDLASLDPSTCPNLSNSADLQSASFRKASNKFPHPFVLAQALQPGSYVSFETALSFHGWIPEAVPLTLSVVPSRRRLEVDHPKLGLFRFYPLALRRGHFLEAIDRQALGGQHAFVAQPLRALLDLVCLRKLEGQGVLELTRSMRIDDGLLSQTPLATWQDVSQVYAHRRMADAVEALRGETKG